MPCYPHCRLHVCGLFAAACYLESLDAHASCYRRRRVEEVNGWMDGRREGRREVGPLLESRVILLCCQRTPKDKEPDFRLRMAGITIRQGATDGSTSYTLITATPTDRHTNGRTDSAPRDCSASQMFVWMSAVVGPDRRAAPLFNGKRRQLYRARVAKFSK